MARRKHFRLISVSLAIAFVLSPLGYFRGSAAAKLGDRNTNQANGSSVQGGVGLPAQLDSRLQSVRAGAWVLDRIQATPRLRVDPGLRVDWNGVAGETLLSPRVSARVDLGRGYALRASAGYFTQSPGY